MATFKVQTRDNVLFDITPQLVQNSGMLTRILNQKRYKSEGEHIIKLHTIQSDILIPILEWLQKHENDPKNVEDTTVDVNKVQLSAWDARFVAVTEEKLISLLVAADKLKIKKLSDLITMSLENLMRIRIADHNERTMVLVQSVFRRSSAILQALGVTGDQFLTME